MQDIRRAMLYPITSLTIALAAILSFAAWRRNDFSPYDLNLDAFARQPWRHFSAILTHGNFMHIFFNCLWIWQLGPIFEARFGTARTAAIFLGTGLSAALAEYAFLRGGIGLSGVVYGLAGMGVVLTKKDRRLFGFLDRRTISYFIFWFFLCVFMTWQKVWPVANIAHGAGFFAGWLFGWCVVLREPKRRLVQAGTAVFCLATVLCAWPTGPVRPVVNLFGEGAVEIYREARKAYIDGNLDLAVERMRLASRYRSAPADLPRAFVVTDETPSETDAPETK